MPIFVKDNYREWLFNLHNNIKITNKQELIINNVFECKNMYENKIPDFTEIINRIKLVYDNKFITNNPNEFIDKLNKIKQPSHI